jgi:hypothetical protein
MFYIVVANAIVFLIDFVFDGISLSSLLLLYPERVLGGEIWRLVTFIFVPVDSSPLFILLTLYFYYMIGMSLEHNWSSFRLNVYYLIGMLTTIAVSLSALLFMNAPVTGTAVNINLTLFLAFASVVPEMRIMIFFVIPVKVKWLGWLTWAFIGFQFITVPGIPGKAMVLLPLANYLVFFGNDIYRALKLGRQSAKNRQVFESRVREAAKEYIHKCSVCGITEIDAPDMVFRYCSKCNGDYEYCSEHLSDHEHVL